MTEHGITTTKAHYWVHLFPLLKRVFWYRVSHCLAYIAHCKIPETLGHSKNGAATGGGYLIPQCAYFVSSALLPDRYLDPVSDWFDLTDRESGLRGQELALVLIEHRIITFPPVYVTALSTRQAQCEGTDFQGKWTQKLTGEIKTEMKTSANLFVQKWESGHRVHLTGNGKERVTHFPSLFQEGAENWDQMWSRPFDYSALKDSE